MDWAHLLTGAVALAAVVTAHVAFVLLGGHSRLLVWVHFTQLVLLAWVAVVSLAAAIGALDLSGNAWPLELALPLLLATYATRQMLAARRVETL
jgi:hypothetical protein